MGVAKQKQSAGEELEDIAVDLLARVGAVEICQRHGLCSRIGDEEYLAVACKLGNHEVKQGKIPLLLSSRKDFTNAIVKAYEEAGWQCNICQDQSQTDEPGRTEAKC